MPEDSANVVYGQLKESAHISSYTGNRTEEFLEILIAGDAWQQVGPGFTDINVFLRSFALPPVGDRRPGLVRRIKELQPDASNRAIANAVGVSDVQVGRDLKPATHVAPEPDDGIPDLQEQGEPATYVAPGPEPDFDDELEDEPKPVTVPPPGDNPEPPGAHVGKNSGDNEWYTPAEFIKAAKAVMRTIDLDPASSEAANDVVGAYFYYTEEQDGLTQPWEGRVWLNPPYAQPLVDRFCTRLAREYRAGSVTEACVLVNNATETNWFQEVLTAATAVCFPRGRVKFWHPNKEAVPLQGQAVIYLGEHAAEFKAEFLRFGPVGAF